MKEVKKIGKGKSFYSQFFYKRKSVPIRVGEETLEAIGKEYYEHRSQLMLKAQLGLTALYNQFHNQKLAEINGETDEKALGKTRANRRHYSGSISGKTGAGWIVRITRR